MQQQVLQSRSAGFLAAGFLAAGFLAAGFLATAGLSATGAFAAGAATGALASTFFSSVTITILSSKQFDMFNLYFLRIYVNSVLVIFSIKIEYRDIYL